MKTFNYQYGENIIEYSENDIIETIEELEFFKEAFLTILNPELAKKTDLNFDEETTLKFARTIYSKTGFDQELINEFFKNYDHDKARIK